MSASRSTVFGALIAVGACALLFLAHVRTALLIFMAILAIDVEIIGMMAMSGVGVSPIAAVLWLLFTIPS